MPDWVTNVSLILSIVVSIFGLCGFSVYINERVKHRANKKNIKEDEKEAEFKKIEEMEYRKLLKEVVVEEVSPLINSVDDIKKDIEKLKHGVQASNRADLEVLVEKADTQGYLSKYEKDRFEQLYMAYHALGKNGVMDASRKRILNLPEHPLIDKKQCELIEIKK